MKRAGVKSEKSTNILSAVSKKVERIESDLSGFRSLFRRFETQMEKQMSHFEERMNEVEGGVKTIVEWGVTTGDLHALATKTDLEMFATKHDLRDFATKNDLERIKFEILDVLKPVIKAIDKDAVTVLHHEKRIAALERKTGIVSA